jgi:hypothetical protein
MRLQLLVRLQDDVTAGYRHRLTTTGNAGNFRAGLFVQMFYRLNYRQRNRRTGLEPATLSLI